MCTLFLYFFSGGGGGVPRDAKSQNSFQGAVVRALASHQCVLGSIPGPGVICGWVFCWFSSLLREVFLWELRFPPPPPPLLKNQRFQIPIRSWNARTFLNKFLWTPWCSMGKQITITIFCHFSKVLWKWSIQLIWVKLCGKWGLSQIYRDE